MRCSFNERDLNGRVTPDAKANNVLSEEDGRKAAILFVLMFSPVTKTHTYIHIYICVSHLSPFPRELK